MSNINFQNRIISTNRNIRQRCHLKYSRHGTLSWDKWMEYDCIFSSDIDVNSRSHSQLELHSKTNVHEPNGKVIDLTQLHSLTCMHGNVSKNEPKDIIILKIGSKRHRLGFDSIYDFNQWKSLFDGVFNSSWDMTNQNQLNENTTVNMLYESATAMRYRIQFADLATQEILCLPTGECELIFDTDKIVLEQRQDKQYTFARSTIRRIRLINATTIEFDLGSRAPVQGCIRFRFESPIDAQSCYSQWNEGVTPLESSYREQTERISRNYNPQENEEKIISPRSSFGNDSDYQPPRPPPRSLSTKSPYYNTELTTTTSSTTKGSQNTYDAFQTLV